MDVQIIQKNLQQQNWVSISLVDINVNNLGISYGKQAFFMSQKRLKKFCESWKELARNIIDFEKKKMLPLTSKELKSHQDATICYICRRWFIKKFAKD